MTDRLSPGMLRDLASVLVACCGQNVWNALTNEAARREADHMNAMRPQPDAPPPPAPNDLAEDGVSHDLWVSACLAYNEGEWTGHCDAIKKVANHVHKALRAERDAANKYADGLASTLFNTRRSRDEAKAEAARLRGHLEIVAFHLRRGDCADQRQAGLILKGVETAIAGEATMADEELSNVELIRVLAHYIRRGTEAEAQAASEAVLARMAGPGEVVVPVKPTPAMRDAMRLASRRDVPSDEMCDVRYAAMLAARPNNGGPDDEAK